MLHGDAPYAARFLKTGDNAVTSRSLREKSARALGVADGGRKANTAGLYARHARKALNKAERLPATVAAHERMDLVDDHIAQVAKHARDRHVLMDQERLERLGRNLQDAARFFDQLSLVRLRDVAMPVPDRDIGLFAEVVEANELVVDECFEGTNVEGAHARGRVLPKLGQDGKEGRLGFAGSRGCRQEYVVLRVKDGVCRRNLDRTQTLPIVGVDEVLDKRGISVKGVHGTSSQQRADQHNGQRLDILQHRRLPDKTYQNKPVHFWQVRW